jgi:prepilin-type N-terminal cleavage/methylation domain-containing protein
MSRRGAAFTLIELLVVIIIIGIVISIVLPALAGARNAVRRTTTEGMMHDIVNAASVFQTDNRRMPGYFSAKDMASQENEQTYGLSATQNVMLELAGIQKGTTKIGPTAAAVALVNNSFDVDTLGQPGGTNTKSYWVPDKRHAVKQTDAGAQAPGGAGTFSPTLPSVVDEWQNPILAWVQDDTMVGKVRTLAQFAKGDSSTTNNPALFYWVPNSAFLKSTAFGHSATDQTNAVTGSMIGSTVSADPSLPKSLAGILGNPAYPFKPQPPNPTPSPYDTPMQARGTFILQSAGKDGIFVGRRDSGGKQFATGFVDYRLSFAPDVNTPIGPANQWKGKDDQPTNIDVMQKFNDVLVAGGS